MWSPIPDLCQTLHPSLFYDQKQRAYLYPSGQPGRTSIHNSASASAAGYSSKAACVALRLLYNCVEVVSSLIALRQHWCPALGSRHSAGECEHLEVATRGGAQHRSRSVAYLL